MRQLTVVCIVALLLWGRTAHAQAFQAHAAVAISGQTWSYTLFNDEPSGSPNYGANFALSVSAPFTVTGTPTGWNYTTNNLTYVSWYNADLDYPYPHDIAPGASLGGFSIQSSATSGAQDFYEIRAWDHTADALGPFSGPATVLVPSTAPVPETTTLRAAFILLGLGSLAIRNQKRTRHSEQSGA